MRKDVHYEYDIVGGLDQTVVLDEAPPVKKPDKSSVIWTVKNHKKLIELFNVATRWLLSTFVNHSAILLKIPLSPIGIFVIIAVCNLINSEKHNV